MASEFNGWSVSTVFASAIGLALAYGTVIIATFGLFMIAMSHDFGWGLGRTSGLLMVGAFCQAPLQPLVGRLIDRVGVRRVALPGIVLYGLSVMLLATANGNPLQVYLLFALVGVASSLVTMVPYSKAVSAWFSKQRGLALSVYAGVSALFGVAVPQSARLLIDHFGWRGGYFALGAAVIVIGFPVLALLLHEPSREAGNARAAPPPLAVSMTAAEARRSPVYWLALIAISLCAISIQAVYAHTVPLLIGRGLSRLAATNAVSMFVLAGIAAQLLSGYLLDHSRSPRAGVLVLGLSLVGIIVLYGAHGAALAIAGAALLGASVGAEMSLAKYLHARYFGNRAFGDLFGLQFMFISLSGGLGPMLMGVLHDRTGGYQAALLLFGGLICVGLIILFSLPDYDRVRAPIAQQDTETRREAALQEVRL